jgi:hypothetical protein
VLDQGQHLLRKAVALAYLGGGLQPLWVDLKGGSSAVLSVEALGPAEWVTVSGLSILPGRYAPHPNPDHVTFGSVSGAPVVIPASGVVDICNAGLGITDTTVGHQPVYRDDYTTLTGCGTAELIMTDSHGSFHARIGVDDADTHKQDFTLSVVVLDKNSHPLRKSSVTAHAGQPAVPFSISIEGASTLWLHTDSPGHGDLFAMTLTGHAVLYDQIFAPSEPPVSALGGTPIPATSLTLACNVNAATQDTLLIHEVALEGWSLVGKGCGVATLNLATVHGTTFSASYGITALDQTNVLIAHLQVTVLDAGGKALRTETIVARAGYGPERLSVDLHGGARLQITWLDSPMVLFALTVA